MKYTEKDFKADIKKADGDYEIDVLCLRRLRLAAMDNGKEGDYAHKLLDVVQGLLDM
jgi:hypothetical protein